MLFLFFVYGIKGRLGGFWFGVWFILGEFGGGVFYGIMINWIGCLLIDLMVEMLIFIFLIWLVLLDFKSIDNGICGK